MKRKLLALAAGLLAGQGAIAGGIVTNTNQSAMFTRMLVRDATRGLDAVYYNPAATAYFAPGLHFSLSNQSIFQTREITSDYPNLNQSTFMGDVTAPAFPSIYAAYSTGKLAFSFGFMPIGGGGSAVFAEGLPSFAVPVSDLVPTLRGSLGVLDNLVMKQTGMNPGFANIDGYQADISFDGSSIYFGYQLGAAYAVNDMIAVGLGGRLVTASNTYLGHIKDVMINAPAAYGGLQKPGQYLTLVGGATGVDLSASIASVNAQTADRYVDAEQSAMGFAPFFSLNIAPIEGLDIALKYEGLTALELETTVNDGKSGGIFVDGAKSNADMPAMLSAGIAYRPIDKLLVTTGFHYFMDKSVNWDGKEEYINDNSWELGLGLEYSLTDALALSAGYLVTENYPAQAYQTDQSNALSSSTIGFGGAYAINDRFELNLGASYTMYDLREKTFLQPSQGTDIITTETYLKETFVVALGLNISLGQSAE